MIKVVGLSISEEISCIKELLTSGAEGFVVKRAAANELAAALRVVHQGGMHIDPRVSASLVGAELNQLHGPQNALSPRENSIIRLVALGYTNKEIATRLDLSVKTVESYKARGMEKAGLRNRVELVRHGAKRGWLTGQD